MSYPNTVLVWDPKNYCVVGVAFQQDIPESKPQDSELYDYKNRVWWTVVGHGKSLLQAFMDAKWFFCMFLRCRPVWEDEKDPVDKTNKRISAARFLREYPVIIQRLYELQKATAINTLFAAGRSEEPKTDDDSVAARFPSVRLIAKDGDEVFHDQYDYHNCPPQVDQDVLNCSFVSEVEVVVDGEPAHHRLCDDEVWENAMDNALSEYDIDVSVLQ